MANMRTYVPTPGESGRELAVGIDIGGTFTDLVAVTTGGEVRTGKVPTTPGDLVDGVMTALGQALRTNERVGFFVHGTTAGLNALLEGRHAPVGLLTTKGFRDVYEIGRANRPAMYDLYYHRPPPLVPRRRRLEVVERLNADGGVLTPLDASSVVAATERLVEMGAASVAVVLLHAYRNPVHELRCEQLIRAHFPGLDVSLSHRIANEWREYERTSTTVVNAAIAPTIRSYLHRMESRLRDRGVEAVVHIMQSNGGITTAAKALERPVNTLLSGPAGGAIAAANLARRAGCASAIAIDMGGTSFDVSLCLDGRPQLAREAVLEGQPLILPVLDVQTIGAGGGSIAWEVGGALRVGPRSAGAAPGPACYGMGGEEPTVTDANLRLGRINPEYFLAGRMWLDVQLAATALKKLAKSLGLDEEDLAEGVLDVVNARMAGLIRQITVGRGLDPRRFVLVPFGGAGPMHAVFLAEELGIDTVLVPEAPGTFSARGMLEAEIRHDLVRPYFARWDRADHDVVARSFRAMREEGTAELAADGVAPASMAFFPCVDLRYVGQEYFLTVPGGRLDARLLRRFHYVYRRTFGHSNPNEVVEVVNLRLEAVGQVRRLVPGLQHPVVRAEGKPYASGAVRFRGQPVDTPRYRREDLHPGQQVQGPCIIDESSCTTVVPDGWIVEAVPSGFLRVWRRRR